MSNVLQAQSYLSTEEAAEVLGLTDGRIRQMLRAGELIGVKLGRRSWAIPSSEIDRVKRRRAEDSRLEAPPAD
jgi:excisionase family DNA binding protein